MNLYIQKNMETNISIKLNYYGNNTISQKRDLLYYLVTNMLCDLLQSN